MVRIALALIFILTFSVSLLAQDPAQPPAAAPAAANDDPDVKPADNSAPSTEGTKWINYQIDDFEDAGVWQGEMPRDQGIIRVMRRDGAPASLRKSSPDTHKYVLGAKISYFKSGPSWFAMSPPREVPIKGITKKLTVWVAGRSFRHELKALVRDFFGNKHLLNFGNLNFPGWNKMESHLGYQVVQDNYKIFSEDRPRGIKLLSMVVECSMDETFGHYYIYLDDLFAFTDVYLDDEQGKDPDNIIDNW